MFEKSEDTAGTTIELLRTSIDAVGLDTSFADDSTFSLFFMLGLVPCIILLVLVAGVIGHLVSREWSQARSYGKGAAMAAVAVAFIYWPLGVDDSSYSENPLRRTISAPAHVDDDRSGSANNTVIAAIHDQVQDELDNRRAGFKDLGLDKTCRTQSSLAGSSRDTLSILCGGHSLDPVVTDKATITPVVETSADQAWWPWSIDPHNVEVTISIEIDKK